MQRVLIDTWWNVNERLFVSVVPPISGFNRYMVECEFKSKQIL